jgi:hypothetical protein
MTDAATVPAGSGADAPSSGQTLSAAAQFPFPADPDRVRLTLQGKLRAQLVEQMVDQPNEPMHVLDWTTLTVEGPVEDVDAGGRTWFVYLGTASTRQLRPIDPSPGPTSSSAVRLGNPLPDRP